MITRLHRRFGHAAALAALLAVVLSHRAAAEDGGVSSISQVGDNHEAIVRQHYAAITGASSLQNMATVAQSGSGQTANITQDGTGLTATVTQTGANNTSIIQQYGNGHVADVTQNGSGFSISIQQFNVLTSGQTPNADMVAVGPGSSVVVHQY